MIISLTIYSLLLLGFTVFSYLFVDLNLFYLRFFYTGFAFENRTITTFVFGIFLSLFFFFYFLFLKNVRDKKINLKKIRLIVGLTIFILFFSYPTMLSYDIFNYITTAKVFVFYKENPYVIMPIEFVGEPFLSFTHAANKIALYGPSWILLTAVPYILSSGNFIAILFTFKLTIMFFYAASLFLIWKLSKNLFSVTFFALNPLVVIETLVGAHNDIVMMFFALLSFYFFMNKKVFLGVISLIVSIFVKYATAALLPVIPYILWKTYRGQKIAWEKVSFYSMFAMFFVFLLSPIREEIYPWYGIWFLLFASISPIILKRKAFVFLLLALSFSLLTRYIPFMLTGTHFGQTPFLKVVLTLIPPTLVFLYFFFKKNLWSQKQSLS